MLPFGLGSNFAVDNSGAIYVSSLSSVYKLVPGAAALQQIAGDHLTLGFSGDNGPAVTALLDGFFNRLPDYGLILAADRNGNLFISDVGNYRVRKIASGGIITSVVGIGPFPANNVPALSVPLPNPTGLVFDSANNLYLQDYSRVLKISPAGNITIFAGTGVRGFSGDGGPASLATLDIPDEKGMGDTLAFCGGNLYIADYGNGRIRQVTPAGLINTYATIILSRAITSDAHCNLYVASSDRVWKIDTSGNVAAIAGNGKLGPSGDGGPALDATFLGIAAVTIDGSGNVYIADYVDGRVRVVTPQGMIEPFAGLGGLGDSGDGGPATQATLCNPAGLAVDAAGNVYIADADLDAYQAAQAPPQDSSCRAVVRMVNRSGIITTFAGGGPAGQLGDGEPATQATLKNPESLAFDSHGNLYIGDLGENRIREVLAAPPAVQAAPTSLSMSAPSGGAPVTQTVAVKGSVPGIGFSVMIDTGSAPNWLTVDSSLDSTPRLLSLTADPSSLPPGPYTATVTITPVAASPPMLPVTVSFQIGPGQPPRLQIDKPEVSFTLPQNGVAVGSPLLIANAGGQTLGYSASFNTASGSNWLAISASSGIASPGKPSTLTVTANPAGLPPGAYTGLVSIQTPVGNQNVPIILTVSANPQAVLLTQTGLSFTAVAQGGVIPPQSFGVLNAGLGAMSWTASALTTSGGNWLRVAPANGTSTVGAPAPQITVTVNPSGLAPGLYYGTARVDAPATANKSRVVTVFLNVLPAGTPLAASVQPPELVFYASPSAGLPSSQRVTVYNITRMSRSFTVGHSSGLYSLPQDGTLDPDVPTSVVVQPNGSTGIGALTFQFDDGTVESLKTTVISSAATSQPGSVLKSALTPRDQPSCTTSQLMITLNSLGQAFQVSAGWPVGLNVSVTDNCENPLVAAAGSVWAHFDDGEDDVVLTALGDGTWQGTWKPPKVNPNVTMTLNARKVSLLAQRAIAGSLDSANDQPSFTLSSIGSAFAAPVPQNQPLAPGSFLSIYGQRLADYAADASGALPMQLGNTQVFFNDIPGAISHVDPGQINVVVPYEVNFHTSNQIRVQRDMALSDPVPVDIADSVLQVNGNAYAMDYPANGSSAFQVGTSAPATAGDVLVMYCVGLGVTDHTIADGAISPASPPAKVPGVTVMIGGQNAAIQFAGLAPGFVGLYQINAVVPGGVAPGTAALTVNAGGQTSPALNFAVQ
jgi:uncharacterized protein (TIGR03437 family)